MNVFDSLLHLHNLGNWIPLFFFTKHFGFPEAKFLIQCVMIFTSIRMLRLLEPLYKPCSSAYFDFMPTVFSGEIYCVFITMYLNVYTFTDCFGCQLRKNSIQFT